MNHIITEKKGFTLVEVMVVLVILGVLAAISVPVYSNYVRKAKVNEAIENISSYANAIRIYRMENGSWPSLDDLKEKVQMELNPTYFTISWDESADDLEITAESKIDDIDGTITYTMNADTYTGTWDDGDTTIIDDYAPYLIK